MLSLKAFGEQWGNHFSCSSMTGRTMEISNRVRGEYFDLIYLRKSNGSLSTKLYLNSMWNTLNRDFSFSCGYSYGFCCLNFSVPSYSATSG